MKFSNKPFAIARTLGALCLALACSVQAADPPRRPECIAPAAPGGGFDLTK